MEWIKVSDALPEIGDDVLCCKDMKDGTFFYGCCIYASYGFPWVSFDDPKPITHWQHIQDPLKEKSDERPM